MREPGSYGTAIGAELVGSQGRPPRFASGRVCAVRGCDTRLSIYNSDAFCALHGRIPESGAATSHRGSGSRKRRRRGGRVRTTANLPTGTRRRAA